MNRQIQVAITLAVLAFAGVAGADNSPTVKLYQAKCAMCHGPDGKGQTPMGKLIKLNAWDDGKTLNALSDADISTMIHVGKAKMPANATLSADELKAMVEYVRTFQK